MDYGAIYINGEMCQSERIRLINRFKCKKSRVIVSTDLLGRGIDIHDITLIINYDWPKDI